MSQFFDACIPASPTPFVDTIIGAANLTPAVISSLGIVGAIIALVACLYFTRAVLIESVGIDDQVGEERARGVEMERIRKMIFDGALTYLNTQYKWLALWVAVLFVLISVLLGPVTARNTPYDGPLTGFAFVIGAFMSATAGYVGMLIATQANSRTAQACKTSISRGLEVSFASGAVMGNAVVGLGLFGLCIFYLGFSYGTPNGYSAVNSGAAATTCANGGFIFTWDNFNRVFNRMAGFGFGASTIGMFARVGGGVFTKAADVGSDLVGKVEQGIPEDDPRNPAVIADNVGDNVGDVAGMGADLFESYAGAVIATATLAPKLAVQYVNRDYPVEFQLKHFNSILSAGVALPLWIDGFGIVASLIGIALIRNWKLDDRTSLETLLSVIGYGVWLSSAITAGFTAICVAVLFDAKIAWPLFGCVIVGLVAGIIIAKFTEYCTAYEFAPVLDIADASEYGPAPVLIKGLGVGMFSVSVPTICIAITILACNKLSGQYGVAVSAVGLLATLGITLATDAYGPVADNAGGIAEMASLGEELRSRTDKLDALGNTTAATGKGLAIASATLTAVGLIAAFVEQSGLEAPGGKNPNRVVDLSDALVLTAVLIGACLPYIFAALTMLSVDRGARAIITEVRLQFATAPKLMLGDATQVVDGHTYPDSVRCVQIATEAAIQEMVLPGVLAVFVPVVIGFILGPKGTTGLLAGALGGCFMLALTMATAGGAWDNAKKWCERCAVEGAPVPGQKGKVTFTTFGVKKMGNFEELLKEHGIEAFVKDPSMLPIIREMGPTGIEQQKKFVDETYHKRHAAVVTGDTVGDPFKDTSGPALNVLIKTMTMMALMLAPAYKEIGEFDGFGATGCATAAVMTVVLSVICFFLVRYFRSINKKRDDESIAKKKIADRRIATADQASRMERGAGGGGGAAGGAVRGGYQAEDASYGLAVDGNAAIPLLRGH